MRRGIALAALAAAIGVLALFGAAPASATTCAVPTGVNGTTFITLNETGIGCVHADERALQVYRHGKTDGYTCHLKFNSYSTSYTCTNNVNAAHTFYVSWHVH
jgi:hypothetical protein